MFECGRRLSFTPFSVLTDFLDTKAERIKLHAFAPNTLKTRRSQWNRYEIFCAAHQLPPFPVTPQNVCRFLVSIGDCLSYVTLNNYVSALNSLGKYYTSDFDLRKDFGISLLLKGFKRLKGDSASRKDPLLPEDLRRIHALVDFSDSKQFLIWTIVLLAFRTLLRKSHFVSTSEDDHQHLLRVCDISFEDWGCKLTINSSKTIQFGERTFDIPVSYCDPPFCVASLLKDWLRKYPKAPTDYLFTWPCTQPMKPLHYNLALDQLKSWATSANIVKDIGFHSLRRGAASYMHSLEIELVSIQKAGDWSSLCVLDYLTVDFAQKRKVERVVSSSM